MRVKDLMHEAVKVSAAHSVAEAAAFMEKKLSGSALVEDSGKIVGIITERDILKKVVARNKNPSSVIVGDVMSGLLITIEADEDILEASRKMDEHRIRRLIVTENGKMVGKITANSISRNVRYMNASRLVESMRF